MKTFKLLLCFLIFNIAYHTAKGQIGSCSIDTLSQSYKSWFQNQKNLKSSTAWVCKDKVIPINFHFMMDTSGNFNFNETNDGMGLNKSGYDYAKDVLHVLNLLLSQNAQMNLPSGNNTQILAKNYRYILNAVYFHRDSFNMFGPFPINNNPSPENQFDVFVQNSVAVQGDVPGGNATWLEANSKIKTVRTNTYGPYRFARINSGNLALNDYYKYIYLEAGLLEHELNHLLTRQHTVLSGAPRDIFNRLDSTTIETSFCPTMTDFGWIDNNCNDDCDDTPSAWYMRDSQNAPHHPGLNSLNDTQFIQKFWSNNRMEYTGYNVMSPCQIENIHTALEGNNMMRSYLLCGQLTTNRNFCSFAAPVLAYYGNQVSINNNCTPTAGVTVPNNLDVSIYFNDELEIFSNFEVLQGGSFEAIKECACP